MACFTRSSRTSLITLISTPSRLARRRTVPEPRLPTPVTPTRTTSRAGAAYPCILNCWLYLREACCRIWSRLVDVSPDAVEQPASRLAPVRPTPARPDILRNSLRLLFMVDTQVNCHLRSQTPL